MYLKSLTLKGFKSFADRSQLLFEPGMTVIVGPNGSGKSNISDAILWVLGEQSAKQLRGQAMEDVIFSGSSARKPVGVAEVDLVLDNSDHVIPIDFEELAITRRMYRSGESEYLINGAPSRLMDIQDILHDSGLGKDTHSIISQGKLDSILRSRPEERRTLIEEAAGISKHKKRKERSLKKVERMDKHLTRARDIQKEINRQLRPLERQVDKAQRFNEAQGELFEIETVLAVDDLRKLREQWSTLETDQKERAAQVELARYRLQEKEKELAKLQTMLEERGLFVGDLAEQRRRMQSILERIDANTRLLEEKGRNMVSRLSEMRSTLFKDEKQLETDKTGLEQVATEREEARAEDSALHTALLDLREKAGVNRANRIALDEKIGQLSAQNRASNKELGETQLELGKAKDALSNFELEDSMFQSRLSQLKEVLDTDHAALVAKRSRLEEITQLLETKKAAVQEAKEAVEVCRRAVADIKAKRSAVESQLSSTRAKAEGLQEIDRSLDSENKLLAHVVDDARVMGGKAARLSEIFTAPKELEALVEQLLSDDLSALVINPKTSSLQNAVGVAQEFTTQEGKAVFWSVEAEAGAVQMQAGADLPERLVDVLTFADAYAALLYAALGDVYVCTSSDQAVSLSHTYPELRFVTKDGLLASKGGRVQVTSQSRGDRQAGTLARKREIKLLLNLIPELEATFESTLKNLEDTEKALALAQEDETSLAREIASLSGEVDSVRQEIGRLELAISSGEAEQVQLSEKRTQALARAEEARPRIETLTAKITELEAAIEKTDEEIAQLTDERDIKRTDEREAQRELSDCQLKIATVTERKKHLEERFETLSASVAELTENIEATRAAAQGHEVMLQRVEPLHEICSALLDKATQWAERLRDQASLEEAGSTDLKKTIEDAREAVNEARKKTDEAVARENELKVAKAGLDVQVEAAVKAITSREGVILEDALALEAPEDRGALEARVQVLKKTLENIGPVNQVAMEEFTKLKERSEYINVQVADLEEARRSLTKIVNAIDRKMRDKFLHTYELVNSNFEDIFATLFPGGKAHLEMTDPDNPAETGIEVVAQPRGKRITKMMLLSGGEKSLTALALLFAVYKTRTVPFYVLDEVEAALDDSNLDRLLEAIDVLREQTQLIVVSHQRRTMERADVLYGVSMQADGVSHVVSQKLDRHGNVVDA